MAVRSLNRIQLIGNLTRDPELRYTPQGVPVASFGVATNWSYNRPDSSEIVEGVDFHNVVAWRKLGELCTQLLHKGDKVFIEGRMNYREWEDEKAGVKRQRAEVVTNDMILLMSRSGGSSGSGSASSPAEQADTSAQENQTSQPGQEEVGEGEVPF